jgi:hypothetical protein
MIPRTETTAFLFAPLNAPTFMIYQSKCDQPTTYSGLNLNRPLVFSAPCRNRLALLRDPQDRTRDHDLLRLAAHPPLNLRMPQSQ